MVDPALKPWSGIADNNEVKTANPGKGDNFGILD
jgi:hypothetical protein